MVLNVYSEFPDYQRYAQRHSVILEAANPEFARLVGIIISQFAIIEDFLPVAVQQITGISKEDSLALLGVFRAFSNKLDLFAELLKARSDGTNEKFVMCYVKDLLSEANSIRNRYAHAKYGGFKHNSKAENFIYLKLFSSNYNRLNRQEKVRLKDFERDKDRLNIIICEVHHILHAKWLPPKLFRRLPQP